MFLVIFCFLYGKFLLLLNYILALSFHEMAHLAVAISKGYTLNEIKFSMFGLSLDLNEAVSDEDLFAVNIAGVVMNLILCLFCVLIFVFLPFAYKILKSFCFANFVLAIFNILPIYPLDGWKVCYSIFKNKRKFFKIDKILRIIFCIVLIVLAIILKNLFSFIFGIMATMLIVPQKRNTLGEYLTKIRKNKIKYPVIQLQSIKQNEDIYDVLESINKASYKIFHFQNIKNSYYTEDEVLKIALFGGLKQNFFNDGT